MTLRLRDRFGRRLDRAWAVYADDLSTRWQGPVPQPTAPLAALPAPAARIGTRRLALICHVFYPDLLDEVRAVADRLPPLTDVFLSVVSVDAARAAEQRFADWPSGSVTVRTVENRGRDIAPKYVGFADVYRAGYELVLFLHTKKSTNEVVGPLWRRFLFDALAGSTDRVDRVLALFDADPALGIVAPQHFGPILPWTGWDGNYPYTRRLARRMGLQARTWSPPDFPSGSMFWARPVALEPITGLALRIQEFPAEDAQIQSTVMHALERLVYVGAADRGYRAAVIGPGASPNLPDAAVPRSTGLRQPSAGFRFPSLLVAARALAGLDRVR